MEDLYPHYLPGHPVPDLQEDGYSREFLDYNRINSDFTPSSYNMCGRENIQIKANKTADAGNQKQKSNKITWKNSAGLAASAEESTVDVSSLSDSSTELKENIQSEQQTPRENIQSEQQSVGFQSPGYSASPANDQEIPGTGVWNPPGFRLHSLVSSSTESEQGSDPRKAELPKARVRTVFSDEQKRRLMQRFHRQKYISPQERTELANDLGLNCKQVKTWYQNRRMKLKCSQYIQPPATSWNQSNFSPISSQTLSLTRGLTPSLMKPHFISYQQQTMPFRQHRTSMEHPIVEVLQSSLINGDPQYPSTSSYLQSFPPTNYPDPDFGGFHKEHLVIPGAQSLNFRNQIPRSGMGFPAVKIHQSPSITQDIQNVATSASFPSPEVGHISSSFNMENFGRDVLVSSQDTQIHLNNWSSVQSDGFSPVNLTHAPVFDGYVVQQPGSANLLNESYPVALSGAL